MKHFILILACLCAMSCSRQTTGIDAFVNQYDQASVRMPGILMPLVKKKLHKAQREKHKSAHARETAKRLCSSQTLPR